MDPFDARKRGTELRTDKSRKGSIDTKILPLIRALNKIPTYFTTSSCSGRIHILVRDPKNKSKTIWLYSTHGKASPAQALAALRSYTGWGTVWLKMESFIFHMSCKTLDDAQRALDWCQASGIKRAGIIAARNTFVVEAIGNETIETPIRANRKSLADERTVRELLRLAQEKLRTNHAHLIRLYKNVGMLRQQKR